MGGQGLNDLTVMYQLVDHIPYILDDQQRFASGGLSVPFRAFPETPRDFEELTPRELDRLILRYQLVAREDLPEDIGARRTILARHLGITTYP
ncbi:hypothetical protein RSOL_513340, partial [Rhizoctonia solani AG-3 Rhs1AP]